jgi:hypothetical protein
MGVRYRRVQCTWLMVRVTQISRPNAHRLLELKPLGIRGFGKLRIRWKIIKV